MRVRAPKLALHTLGTGAFLALALLYANLPQVAVPLMAFLAIVACYMWPAALLFFLPLGTMMRPASGANLPLADGRGIAFGTEGVSICPCG